MIRLLNLFYDICLFRAGPEDIPVSRAFSYWLVGLYLIAATLVSMLFYNLVDSIARTLLDAMILIAMAALVLRWQGYSARIGQTVSALMGTGILLTLVTLPLLTWLISAKDAGQDLSLPVLFWYALFLWSLAINTHIIRRALAGNMLHAVIFTAAYFLLSLKLIDFIFPPAA